MICGGFEACFSNKTSVILLQPWIAKAVGTNNKQKKNKHFYIKIFGMCDLKASWIWHELRAVPPPPRHIFPLPTYSDGQSAFPNDWHGVSLHPVSFIHIAERLRRQRSVSPNMKWVRADWRLQGVRECVKVQWNETSFVYVWMLYLHNCNLRRACSLSVCDSVCVWERSRVIKIQQFSHFLIGFPCDLGSTSFLSHLHPFASLKPDSCRICNCC